MSINKDIINIILSNVDCKVLNPIYSRLEINDSFYLNPVITPQIAHSLERYGRPVNWALICRHTPYVKHIPIDKIDWIELSLNPNQDAIELLKANPEKINWSNLSTNPGAIEYLETNQEKINWMSLSFNRSPKVFDIIEKNITRINWVSEMENTEELRSGYQPERIDWFKISENPGSNDLIRANPNRIDWSHLSYNKNATNLLKSNIDMIEWEILLCYNSNWEDLLSEIIEKSKTCKCIEEIYTILRFNPKGDIPNHLLKPKYLYNEWVSSYENETIHPSNLIFDMEYWLKSDNEEMKIFARDILNIEPSKYRTLSGHENVVDFIMMRSSYFVIDKAQEVKGLLLEV